MATVEVTIPQLTEAMNAFIQERWPKLAVEEEISRVVSYQSAKLGLSFSGRLVRNSSGLRGYGQVTLNRHERLYVYYGNWHGNKLTFDRFLSEDLEVQEGKVYLWEPTSGEWDSKPYLLPERQVAVDGTHMVVKDSPLEFPAVPGQYIRIAGPDGEYLELDVETEKSATTLMEVCDQAVHRVTRSFVAQNRDGEPVQGYLDVWPSSQLVRWSKEGHPEVEVQVDLKKFQRWFYVTGTYSRERNLLRALELEVPCFPKKLPVLATATTRAS